jgi:serine-type D-Ala-D-Ala carboxypeptidase/endopeptidase (penicillin-binding protein 4)
MVRVDTVFVDLWSNKCPVCRCPAPDAAVPCAPAPRSGRSTAATGAETWLWNALDSMAKADYEPKGGVLGAMVMRTRDSMVVWSRTPDARMLPASTQKLWSNGAGLSELGFDFRWYTTLWMQGRINGSVLNGNLLLEGGGDPTLGAPDGTGLSVLVNVLAAKGVREVKGNLVAVDTLVGRGQDAWPQGWTISSSRDGYGAPVLGLNWNHNRVGDRALTEPRAEALKALRTALLDRNITVKGTDTTVRVRGDSVLARRNWTRLATVPSPSLENVARVCLRESVNPFAEAIVLGLGMGRSRAAPREAGRRRMQEWAASLGFDPSKLVLDDGSGLSRYDLVTARQMARLMSLDTRGRMGSRLIDFMPAGGQGTLRRRFMELPDRSLVIAKTGTLDGVVNLVGVLMRPGRDTLAFAFLCNGFSGGARPVRKIQDRMLALVAGVALNPMSVADTSADAEANESGRPESNEAPGEAIDAGVSGNPGAPPASPPPRTLPAAVPADPASPNEPSAVEAPSPEPTSSDSTGAMRSPALLPEVDNGPASAPEVSATKPSKAKKRSKKKTEASSTSSSVGARTATTEALASEPSRKRNSKKTEEKDGKKAAPVPKAKGEVKELIW